MRKLTFSIAVICVIILLMSNLKGIYKEKPITNIKNIESKETCNEITSNLMKITIGTTVFNATFYDNATVAAFKEMLPLTLNMSDLNGNEKYFNFSIKLPTNTVNIRTIETGDLMLYGNNCLVLFYSAFNTSYNYTKLAKISNTVGLQKALGTENSIVKFELE